MSYYIYIYKGLYMNNTKLFLGLALAGIYATCGACEDANFYRDRENILPVASPVEVVEFEEVPEDNSSDRRLADLYGECYKNDNAQACQQLLALAEKKNLIDKLLSSKIIIAQWHTINIHEKTIQNFNELNRRRNNRINKRAKKAREKELSEKLNKEN